MPDLIAISQGLNAVKAATEIVKTIAGLRDSANLLENTVELNQKILSVQTALADAQSEQASLIQRIGELEKEVTALKSWEAEKQRYELKRYDSGSLFYTLKEAEARGEPVHIFVQSATITASHRSYSEREALWRGNRAISAPSVKRSFMCIAQPIVRPRSCDCQCLPTPTNRQTTTYGISPICAK
jgi:hypothetical protein